MKRKNSELIKSIIPLSLKDLGIEQQLDEQKVALAWNEIFGADIAKYTEHVFVKRNTLYLKITSSMLKNNLILQKDLLIAKLNQVVDKDLIRDIIFL